MSLDDLLKGNDMAKPVALQPETRTSQGLAQLLESLKQMTSQPAQPIQTGKYGRGVPNLFPQRQATVATTKLKTPTMSPEFRRMIMGQNAQV